MAKEVKVLATVIIVTLVIMGLGIGFFGRETGQKAVTAKVAAEILLGDPNQQTGPSGAMVTVVEFGDYQCPSCAAVEPALAALRAEYQGRVNFVFRHYPLSQHQHAMLAAQAAAAAAAQGQFWPMHTRLYQEQLIWEDSINPQALFEEYAADLGLNVEQFRSDLEQERYRPLVQQDMASGNQAKVAGTPHFYVNGENLGSSLVAVQEAVAAALLASE